MDGYSYRVRCIDNSDVVIKQSVNEGDEVYYTPFYVDEDTMTIYGYVTQVNAAKIKAPSE